MKNNDLSDPLYLAKALINCPSETPNDAGAIALLEVALKNWDSIVICFLLETQEKKEGMH